MAGNKPTTEQSLFDRMSSEVTPEVSPLLLFLTNNARYILIGLAICIAVGAGYGIYSWQARGRVEQAQNDLGGILVTTDSAARLAKLEEFLAKAPSGMRTAVVLAVANAAMEAGKHDAAINAWGELAKDSGNPLYSTALIGKARSLALADRSGEALAVLESAALPADSSAANLINSLIVDLAQKTGDTARAVAACEKLVAANGLQNPEEAEFWRQKAAFLRLQEHGAKS